MSTPTANDTSSAPSPTAGTVPPTRISPARPVMIISGTNRPGSNAMRLATLLAELYQKQNVAASVLSLTELAPEIFTPEAYATKPPSMVILQQRVLDAAGLHIVTPEYNGSFPGVLKHFLDLLKYPDSFEHKPVAFLGEANGMWGGLRAVEHLQGIFAYRNSHQFPRRVFISGVKSKFGPDGKLTDSDLLARIEEQCSGFARFIESVAH